jgi:hypothetical protein
MRGPFPLAPDPDHFSWALIFHPDPFEAGMRER